MIQSVKVKNLSLSKDNVRKCKRAVSVEAMAASIAAQGLLQNLIVTPLKKAGTYTVKAGGVRLRALQLLIEQGTLPADHEVPVLVLADEGGSVEASLAENFNRTPMNPADECDAFKHFIDKGASAEDVAKRFGVTTRFVEQRVRLAELAPAIFEALAAGEITLGVAQAYAVTADTDRQARVFEQMKQSYYGNQPDNIRRAILNGTVKANDAKARFVGRDVYVAAGGRIEGDLFAQDTGDENWTDVDLLEELAGKKLEAAAAELAQEQGLAFVTPIAATNVPYDMERQLHEFHATARPLTDEEQALVEELGIENDALVEALNTELEEGTPEAEAANDRLEAIEREIDEIDTARRAIAPAVKGQLGTFVYIGNDGQVRVHARMFSEKKVVDPHAPVGNAGGGAGEADGADEADHGPRYSAALVDELATQRRQILVAHLASDPAIALDLTIFLMAQDLVFSGSYVRAHSTLKASTAQMPIFAFRDEASMASQTIEDQRQQLDTSWVGHDTMSARFDAFQALDDQARGAWVAYSIAQTLEAPPRPGSITEFIRERGLLPPEEIDRIVARGADRASRISSGPGRPPRRRSHPDGTLARRLQSRRRRAPPGQRWLAPGRLPCRSPPLRVTAWALPLPPLSGADPMKPFTVQCEYSAHHRFEATVEAEDPIAACRAAIELANDSSDWRSRPSLPPEGCGTWAAASRPQPRKPGRVAATRLPAPPRFSGFPSALPRCGRPSIGGPGGAHPAGRPPAPPGERLSHMTTSLAAALAALELGHLEPGNEDLTGMAPPPIEALDQTTTAIWSDLFATLFNTSLERDIEELGWGLVNLFHRAASKKHATIDRLTDEIRLLIAEQDGSEINSTNLEDKIELAKKIEEAAGCYEHMRDTAAAHYLRETGRSWIPATGNRISLGVTSAIVDGQAFLRARRERVRDANTAQGTAIVFAGGRLTFQSDDDMKTFGDNLLRTLNAVRERVGDMYLVHGGDMKGIERIAASWAEQHSIQQVRFGLDRKLGDRAGFRRNEQMLSLKPRYVIAFQGNGVTERLVIDAKKAGIRVVDRRGPLGTPPAAQNAQRDRKVA